MDLIDRLAAIDAAIEAADSWDGGYNKLREGMIRDALNALPSAQPERKMGKWMTRKLLTEDLEPTSTIMYKCPFCGWEVGLHVDYDPWNYCPNCGAEMEQ